MGQGCETVGGQVNSVHVKTNVPIAECRKACYTIKCNYTYFKVI